MADETKPFKKKLTITDQRELAVFPRNGEDATLYEVDAVNEDGKKIEKLLRTFQPELPQGELIEFEVKEYVHEKFGKTFTIKMPSRGRASKKDIGELRTQVSSLADRLGAVEREIAELRADRAREEPLPDPPKEPGW